MMHGQKNIKLSHLQSS